MTQSTHIAVLGGDSRFLYTANQLKNIGYTVSMSLFEKAEKPKTIHHIKPEENLLHTDIVLLPLPVTKDGVYIHAPFSEEAMLLSDFFHRIQRNATVFCGKPSEELTKILQAKKCTVIDYYNREEFQIRNAVLTAEGTLAIIIDKLSVSVFGLQCGVTGYGRVGEQTARLLHALGAKVTVFARSKRDRCRAEINGLTSRPIEDLSLYVSSFDCLVNTIPSTIIDNAVLRNIRQSCLLLDLASAPYGIDNTEAISNGISYMRASSLPGKTAPQSAGEIIAETIHSILSEGSS